MAEILPTLMAIGLMAVMVGLAILLATLASYGAYVALVDTNQMMATVVSIIIGFITYCLILAGELAIVNILSD
mgnify:CR=1 FL=1